MYHHQKLKSEHRNRYSINFKAGISICPSDSEMRLSKRTALPEKRRKRAEEEEGQKVNGEGKTVGNFNLPRVTKRLATPRIATLNVEFVTALFRVNEKRRGKIVAIEARCACMRACLDGIGSSLPLRRESKLRYIVSDVEAARSLDFYSISFHLSLLPPSVLHPYPRRPHPSTSLRALPFHAIDFPFAKRKNVSSADSGGGGGRN